MSAGGLPGAPLGRGKSRGWLGLQARRPSGVRGWPCGGGPGGSPALELPGGLSGAALPEARGPGGVGASERVLCWPGATGFPAGVWPFPPPSPRGFSSGCAEEIPGIAGAEGAEKEAVGRCRHLFYWLLVSGSQV